MPYMIGQRERVDVYLATDPMRARAPAGSTILRTFENAQQVLEGTGFKSDFGQGREWADVYGVYCDWHKDTKAGKHGARILKKPAKLFRPLVAMLEGIHVVKHKLTALDCYLIRQAADDTERWDDGVPRVLRIQAGIEEMLYARGDKAGEE